MLRKLWFDEAGFVISAELVLIATILVIGMIVGLTTIRDQVTQELGDVAVHLAQSNQSYSFSGITGHHSSSAGTQTTDRADDCDHVPAGPIFVPDDGQGVEPACIELFTDASAE